LVKTKLKEKKQISYETNKYTRSKTIDFASLKGLVPKSVEVTEWKITLHLDNEVNVTLGHSEAMSSVSIESIVGDINDLVGEEILMAEESKKSTEGNVEDNNNAEFWTFYKLATRKGFIDIRFYGDGYYADSADTMLNYVFEAVKNELLPKPFLYKLSKKEIKLALAGNPALKEKLLNFQKETKAQEDVDAVNSSLYAKALAKAESYFTNASIKHQRFLTFLN
jgi:hypothetical protein